MIAVPPEQLEYCFLTSGTSGKGQEVHAFTAADLQESLTSWAMSLHWSGVMPGDTAYLMVPVGVTAGPVSLLAAFQRYGLRTFAVGAMDGEARLAMMQRFQPQFFSTGPVYLRRLTIICQERGIVPRYLLKDPNGRAVTDGDFRGRFQLISFGYTFCPDICPTTLVETAQILKQLGDEAARVQPIFISLDPERDTPEQLKAYTAFFDPRILGLTGSPELVGKAAEHFKVRYEKVQPPGASHYSIDHSAGMYLLGLDGAFVAKLPYGMPVPELIDRIREALAESPGR